MRQVRQGDVLIVPVDEIPDGAVVVPPEQGRVILARGEATGHHHSFAAGAGTTLLESPTGERFVRVEVEDGLEHQEHDTIPVLPGTGRVIRQREYDDSEEFRRVAD